MMYLRIEAREKKEEETDEVDGRDTRAGWGQPPPEHVLRQLPGWESNN